MMTHRLNLGLRFVSFACASTSIGALLAQFYGVASMRVVALTTLLPACVALAGLGVGARRVAGGEFTRRLLIGLWVGWWATVAYDLWRAPFFLLAMNPFKAHPLFGALLTGLPPQDVWAQVIGWLYHFSNGIGFGVMYMMAVRRPAIWSAVLWGIVLETAMLVTPYRDVFDIPLTGKFLFVSGSAHVVYGVVLGVVARHAGHRFWSDAGWHSESS